MNRTELAGLLAEKHNLTKAGADEFVRDVFDNISRTMSTGGEVSIHGFGSFKGERRAARTGRNPRTGQTMPIAATTVPKFKPSATLKREVAGA